ncbi:MAG: hypothetical protein QME32_05740, partial [Endomicrobiia bacterium]|nr:hypothetical protein [Endomicrobiia bacterium]
LAHAPLPNVYSNGNICQGTAKFPKCRVDTMSAAANAFFESIFNEDLSTDKCKGHGNVITLLQNLGDSGAREFPAANLNPFGLRNVSELIEALKDFGDRSMISEDD